MKTIAFIVGQLFTCTRSDLGYLYKRVDLIQEMSFPLLAFHPPDTVKKKFMFKSKVQLNLGLLKTQFC